MSLMLGTITLAALLTLSGQEPIDANNACEDELGNTYFLPLDRYQAGMRPVGPCLPVGTWSAIRQHIESRPRQPADRPVRNQETLSR